MGLKPIGFTIRTKLHGLTQHALENVDVDRLADLIEAFLNSENQSMRDAVMIGLARSQQEMSPEEYAAALDLAHKQLDADC